MLASPRLDRSPGAVRIGRASMNIGGEDAATMLLPGDWVEVRPAPEILSTLDPDDRLDGLPFMPEMLPHCGRRFRVVMRAERTCVHPPEIPLRRMRDAVILAGLRCDGSAHAGCQLGCMTMWKEAWLRPVDGPGPGAVVPIAGPATPPPASPPPATRPLRVLQRDDPAAFTCQGTELPRATEAGEAVWRPGPWLRMLRVRTFTPLELFAMVARIGTRKLARLARAALGLGAAPAGARPAEPDVLGLAAGDWVEVKSREEIAATLDAQRRHKGLAFSAEMFAFCGRKLRVARRVERILAEDTGRPRNVRDTVILDGAVCDRYLGCARGMPLLWREAWLRRTAAPARPEVPGGPRRPDASPGERHELGGRG